MNNQEWLQFCKAEGFVIPEKRVLDWGWLIRNFTFHNSNEIAIKHIKQQWRSKLV